MKKHFFWLEMQSQEYRLRLVFMFVDSPAFWNSFPVSVFEELGIFWEYRPVLC